MSRPRTNTNRLMLIVGVAWVVLIGLGYVFGGPFVGGAIAAVVAVLGVIMFGCAALYEWAMKR